MLVCVVLRLCLTIVTPPVCVGVAAVKRHCRTSRCLMNLEGRGFPSLSSSKLVTVYTVRCRVYLLSVLKYGVTGEKRQLEPKDSQEFEAAHTETRCMSPQ